MRVVQEFSRFADQYDTYSIIQTKVAERLVEMLEEKAYQNVIDIGCGSGAVYKEFLKHNIVCEQFYALDFSTKMLELHPSSSHTRKILFDFNDSQSFLSLPVNSFDVVLSSSALQWSNALEKTLEEIKKLSNTFYFAIFTSNTFATMHQLAGISSPIYSEAEIVRSVESHYNATFEKVFYQLKFDDTRKMFQYIKKSGVSGGKKQLGFQSLKRLMQEYPYNYLEFEVLFVKAVC